MGKALVDDAVAAIREGRAVVVECAWTGVVLAQPLSGGAEHVVAQGGVQERTRREADADPAGTLREIEPATVAVDLLRIAECDRLVFAELTRPASAVPVASVAAHFAAEHDLPLIDVDELIHHRWSTEVLVESVAVATLPLPAARFDAHAFRSSVTGIEHVALVLGDVAGRADVLVRVHSECLTGDVFGSLRCDCGEQLVRAQHRIVEEGRGVLVYLRGHEGRGIGLAEKLRAYALQQEGHDTWDANVLLGHPPDGREFGDAAQILRALGPSSVRVLTNNPAKIARLSELGVEVTGRVPLPVEANAHNAAYLDTKRRRFGHL